MGYPGSVTYDTGMWGIMCSSALDHFIEAEKNDRAKFLEEYALPLPPSHHWSIAHSRKICSRKTLAYMVEFKCYHQQCSRFFFPSCSHEGRKKAAMLCTGEAIMGIAYSNLTACSHAPSRDRDL